MKKVTTLLVVTMIMCGVAAMAGLASAQASEDPYTRVVWETVSEFYEFDHSEQNSQWVFGPQPSIWIEYADNSTNIKENHYLVENGTDLLVNIIIPKSFLGTGNELDTVQFWATTYLPRSPLFVLQYNATADDWAVLSFYYQPGSQEPTSGDFVSLDVDASSYTEGSEQYELVFAIVFEEKIVEDVFWTGLNAIDTDGHPVSPSWLAAMDGGFPSPPIGLGTAVSPRDFSLPDYYYGDIIDPSGDIVHYVAENDTFIVRLRSSAEFGEIVIPFAYLTHDPDYMQNITIPMPEGDLEEGMWNINTNWTTVEYSHPPMMFLMFNGTDTYVVGGYPNITWSWTVIAEGIGVWIPRFDVLVNETIIVGDYFVLNTTYTGSFDDGHRVQWSGYFTSETDMDAGRLDGAIINPEMGLAVVLDIEGDPIAPRPEIAEKQTMKLAYKKGFIEAFVYDAIGDIALTAMQGDQLNLTMLVHVPYEHINGSFTYGADFNITAGVPATWNITRNLTNFTIVVSGGGSGCNETHYWHSGAIFGMNLDFETDTATTWTWLVVRIYERGFGIVYNGWELLEGDDALWHVSDFGIELGEDLSVLKVDFKFDEDAPDIVIDSSELKVGYDQEVSIWDGPVMVPFGPFPLYQTIVEDLSGDTLWSPRHLRLGDVERWMPEIWTVTEDGAIDLDGNTYTTEDQYFVKRTGFWEDWGNLTTEGMAVVVLFDPSPDEEGDEFVSWNWMGIQELNIGFSANETFYWYHASDYSLVDSDEMEDIREVLWADDDVPTPGYGYVAWLSENRTLDLTAITGLDSNSWSSTWLAWGTQQAFLISVSNTTVVAATFRAQYAGLLLFNDMPGGASPDAPDFVIENGRVVTDEVTHVVLIDSVESIELRQPFGATNGTGDVRVDPDTEVTFGISIYDVDVTIYPLQIQNSDGLRGPWAFRESYEGAMGLNSTDFDYWITHANVDEMAFDITFNADMVEYDAEDPTTWNHVVSFKVDQIIGNWTLDEFDNSVLESRGLAVNFFAVLGTVGRTQYQAGEAPVTDPNADSTAASYYQFGADDNPYANVTMGGLPYYWGGDDFETEYISGSSTAPIGAFSLAYESTSGDTVTDWNVDASMLFMTAGYTNWGGHAVHCDPVFVAYTSAHQTTPMGPTSTTTTIDPTPPDEGDGLIVLVGGAVILIVLVVVLLRRRR